MIPARFVSGPLDGESVQVKDQQAIMVETAIPMFYYGPGLKSGLSVLDTEEVQTQKVVYVKDGVGPKGELIFRPDDEVKKEKHGDTG